MKINHKTASGTMYVSLCGEIDESSANSVRQDLDELMRAPEIRKVVLDLEGVSFMDSTGIGMLIGRYKTLKSRGIPILLAKPSYAADKVLSLSGIYEIMPKINL